MYIYIYVTIYLYKYIFKHIHIWYTGQQQEKKGVQLQGLLGRSMSYHQASIYLYSWLVWVYTTLEGSFECLSGVFEWMQASVEGVNQNVLLLVFAQEPYLYSEEPAEMHIHAQTHTHSETHTQKNPQKHTHTLARKHICIYPKDLFANALSLSRARSLSRTSQIRHIKKSPIYIHLHMWKSPIYMYMKTKKNLICTSLQTLNSPAYSYMHT